MNGPREYFLSKVSPTEKDKYHMIPLFVVSKKNKVNEQTKQNATHRYREHSMMTRWERGWEEVQAKRRRE